MALPITTLLIHPKADNALTIDDLDYELLKRRDLGLVYIQAGGEAQRFATTWQGWHRVQVYDEDFILPIASLIFEAGWTVRDQVSPHEYTGG